MNNDYEQLAGELREHIAMEDIRWIELIEATRANADAINKQIEATEGLIELYNTMIAGQRLFAAVGRFAKWVGSMAVFVAIYHFSQQYLR